MPRKTKEQKELEEKKVTKKSSTKKATTTKKKSSTAKKATATKKASTTKKATTSKKSSTKKPTTAKKKTATKKAASTKKASSNKATTTKKSTVKKTTATKKSTVQKKTTRKKAVKKPVLEVAEYYDLPYRYNQTVVKILAQTPSTLFVYWEISDEDIENYKKQYGEKFFEITRPVLIIHNKTLDYSFEIDINDFANSWYLKVNNTKCEYSIELGRRPIEYSERISNYIYVAKSNDIQSPNDHILLESFPNIIKFRNVKTNAEYFRKMSDLSISKTMNKIYNIYDLYKLIYEDENLESLNNPSSGGSSTFK